MSPPVQVVTPNFRDRTIWCMSRIAQWSAVGLALLIVVALPCQASSVSLTGSLDPNDPNDVFVYGFTLSAASTVTIQTYGYGGTSNAPAGKNAAGQVISAGGFDPYVSLFLGIGAGATFLASNDDGACPPGYPAPACHDATLVSPLAAGAYTLALSVFDNFSFAENLATGTLGDGFIGLGSYFDAASGTDRTSNYAVDISANGPITPTPEPGTWLVDACALSALVLANNLRNQIIKGRVQ
jgi:hypothetical protein